MISNIPELEKFKDISYSATGPEEFAEAIKKAIKEDAIDHLNKMIDKLKEN